MPEARTIPWLRLVVEALLIVLSILAAFGIDAWWDRTQRQRNLEANLEAISAGLQESRARIVGHLERISDAEASLERWLSMTPTQAADIPFDSTLIYVTAIERLFTSDDNRTFLGRALDDEALASIESASFARAIVEFRTVNSEIEELDGALAQNSGESLMILGRHAEVGRLYAGQLSGVGSDEIRALRADPEVHALATRRLYSIRRQLALLRRLDEAERMLLGEIEVLLQH